MTAFPPIAAIRAPFQTHPSDAACRAAVGFRLVAHRALTDGARDQDWALIDAELFRTKALIRSRRGASVWSRLATLGNHSHSRAFRPCRRFEDLAEEWDAPVYAHSLEHPYLNGTLSYPPPDPTVGGGLMAVSASLFPRGPVDVSEHLRMLPEADQCRICVAGAGYPHRGTRPATYLCGVTAIELLWPAMPSSPRGKNRSTLLLHRSPRCTVPPCTTPRPPLSVSSARARCYGARQGCARAANADGP
jgi:hypothetical protein